MPRKPAAKKEVIQVSSEQLERISVLANAQIVAEEKVTEVAETLKDANEALRKIQEDLLPDLMKEIGLQDFTLVTGEKVTIKTGIAASISKANQPLAFKWLRDNKLGDIIKSELKVNFGRGEEKKARKIIEQVKAIGLTPSARTSVHTGTLKALMREQLEKGVNVPQDLFGIHDWAKSIIKTKK